MENNENEYSPFASEQEHTPDFQPAEPVVPQRHQKKKQIGRASCRERV